MLKSLGWPTLQARRNYLKLLLTYKILKAMISIPSNNFKPVTFNTRGYQSHFQCLQTTCDSYRFSFFPSAIRLWNCLSTDVTSIASFNEYVIATIFVSYVCVAILLCRLYCIATYIATIRVGSMV